MSTGLDVLVAEPERLAGARIGLITNYTGVTRELRRNVTALRDAGLCPRFLFGPEHGLNGTAQAGYSEAPSVDEETGLPVVDTYEERGSGDAVYADRGLDTLVLDLQDVGVRYWTYVSTMYDAMLAAARLGLRFVVADRPNPLGGVAVEGPDLVPEFASFVGRAPVAQRHGLTMGELALLFNRRWIPQAAGRPVELDVVPVSGWSRDDSWAATGLPWVMPSPNLPTVDTAYAFAATGLLEGTNVSEGRGTTRPFELFGAPYVDARLVPALDGLGLAGVRFREAWFQPTFHKHAGVPVRGAQLHVTDPLGFEPVRTGVVILRTLAALYPADFAVLAPRADADADHAGHPLDRLWGSDVLRTTLGAGGDVEALVPAAATTADRYPSDALIY